LEIKNRSMPILRRMGPIKMTLMKGKHICAKKRERGHQQELAPTGQSEHDGSSC
jgi:hypothetical protein